MTQTLLSVAVSIGEDKETPKCNPPNTDTSNWNAVLNDIKGCKGDPQELKNNMDQSTVPAYPQKLAKGWDLFECDQNTFPTQTHHLLPEKMVPKHEVSIWLTDKPKVNSDKYKLKGDTTYNTNGAQNGYFMPFASTTHQWNDKPSKQMKVCFEMMRLTKKQLHQGRHSTTDYMEELEIETDGYNTQAKAFLLEIYQQVLDHIEVTKCEVCKKKDSIEVEPLRSTVAMMEQASRLMKVLIQRNNIAVSGRAAAYIASNSKTGKFKHPDTPYVQRSEFS